MRRAGIGLSPARDVAPRPPAGADGWRALSAEPWLRIDVDLARHAGAAVRMDYEASWRDVVARPVLRFERPGGDLDVILPAPALGRGQWIGLVPADATGCLISPVDAPGPFGFRIVDWRGCSAPARFALGFLRRPGLALTALWSRVRGKNVRAEMQLSRALTTMPPGRYRAWARGRRRAPDWAGLDAPAPEETATAAPLHLDIEDPSAPAALAACPEDGLVLLARAGVRLGSEAAAIVAVAAARQPADAYLIDEEDEAGGPPRLKPGWCPVLAESVDLFGPLWAARAGWARARLQSVPGGRLAGLRPRAGDRVVHIARPLVRCRQTPAGERPRPAAPAPPARRDCALIIPTRDRLDLLMRCLDSLRRFNAADPFEAVIVDNGSVEPQTRAFLDRLGEDRRFRVLARPGPFNFSALCNDGAQASTAATLVFLNNDVEILDGAWLARLCGWAQRPDIGAVGARLLYPDSTLQHGGVVIGLHGLAGHFERGGPGARRGYLDRLCVPHETGAVTGACLAVERGKFDAVGGFDAAHLPVDLNDVDLCLRLAERGWRCLLDPTIALAHHESASRGKAAPAAMRYRDETAWFRARWRAAIRRDPCFSPSLSLASSEAALG